MIRLRDRGSRGGAAADADAYAELAGCLGGAHFAYILPASENALVGYAVTGGDDAELWACAYSEDDPEALAREALSWDFTGVDIDNIEVDGNVSKVEFTLSGTREAGSAPKEIHYLRLLIAGSERTFSAWESVPPDPRRRPSDRVGLVGPAGDELREGSGPTRPLIRDLHLEGSLEADDEGEPRHLVEREVGQRRVETDLVGVDLGGEVCEDLSRSVNDCLHGVLTLLAVARAWVRSLHRPGIL